METKFTSPCRSSARTPTSSLPSPPSRRKWPSPASSPYPRPPWRTCGGRCDCSSPTTTSWRRSPSRRSPRASTTHSPGSTGTGEETSCPNQQKVIWSWLVIPQIGKVLSKHANWVKFLAVVGALIILFDNILMFGNILGKVQTLIAWISNNV